MNAKTAKAIRLAARDHAVNVRDAGYEKLKAGVLHYQSGFQPDGKPLFKVCPLFTLRLHPECGRARYKQAKRCITKAGLTASAFILQH